MVKFVAMMKRKSGMTAEEFSQYWYEKHAPLVMEVLPGIKRYVQNHAVKLPGRTGEPRVDGILELWFEDLESWQRFTDWYFSDDGKVLRDDELKFIDMSTVISFVAEEKVIKP